MLIHKAVQLAIPLTNSPQVRRSCRIVAGLLLVVGCSMARELVHFQSGFSLEAISHSVHGDQIEICTGTGTLEFSRTEISSFEALSEPVATAIADIDVQQIITPEALLSQSALSQGMDAALVRSVARIESGLKQASISPKGAVGLMQLMPATAKSLGVNPNRPEENVRGGVVYLRNLLIQYSGNSALALAAYNAGPGAVQKYKGVPPFLETRKYVIAVLKEYQRQLRLEQLAKAANKPSATD